MLTEIGFVSFLLPLMLAAVLVWLMRTVAGEWRGHLICAIGVALLVPSGLLLGGALIAPTRHSEWFGLIAVAGLATGLIGCRRGSSGFERGLWLAVLSGLAAWCVVPGWPDLAPQRTALTVSLAAGMGFVTVASVISVRVWPRIALGLIALVAVASAGWIAKELSLSLSRWLLIVGGVSIGLLLPDLWRGIRAWRGRPTAVRVLTVTYLEPAIPLLAVWLVAGLFLGWIEPNPPRPEFGWPAAVLVGAALAAIAAKKSGRLALDDSAARR